MLEEVMTGILPQRGLFMYIRGQMELRMTPVAARRSAYSVSSKAFLTAGAVVKTVGMATFFRPFSARPFSTLSVQHLILRGIFLLRKSEIDFFYQEGSSWVFPDFHEEFINLLPPVERRNVLHNYYRRLTGTNEEEKIKFARAWTKWEMSTSHLFVDQDSINRTENDVFITQFARIETHYFVNGGFFEKENQLLEDAHKIENIPTIIVQGRYDMVCPAKSAYDMSKKLKNCELHMIPDAGHSAAEPGIIDGLVRATEKFKNEN